MTRPKATGPEIVRALERDVRLFKSAHRELARRDPDAETARAIVASYRAGTIPSWLAASLLGATRDRAGYDTVIEILGRGDGSLSESYAAGSARQIAGAECEHDLARVVDACEHESSRRAAAHVLGSLGTESALARLISAAERGRLRARSIADGLVGSHVDPAWVATTARSAHREVRRIAPMVIAARVRARERGDAEAARELDACARSAALLDALARVIAEGEETVWRADARAIESWMRDAERR